jgi:valyl-tRNA synthetase
MQLDRISYKTDAPVTALADRWLLTKLSKTIQEVSESLEGYQFDKAMKAIREFARDVLADNYIEVVKGRLYSDSPERDGACVAIRTSLDAICRMLAPFTPYFAEEVWSYMGDGSVHQQPWVNFSYKDEEAESSGEILIQVVSEIRRYKHDKGLALNAPIGKVTVYTTVPIDDAHDASLASNCTLTWKVGIPELTQVVSGLKFDMGIIGPKLRGKAKRFMQVC